MATVGLGQMLIWFQMLPKGVHGGIALASHYGKLLPIAPLVPDKLRRMTCNMLQPALLPNLVGHVYRQSFYQSHSL